MDESSLFRWLPVVFALLALSCLVFALSAGRRHLLIAYLPTSKAANVFVGHVELIGLAETETPMKSQFAGVPCVWFRITLSERDPNNAKDWRTRVVTQELPFNVRDESGTIRIVPVGARVKAEVVWDRRIHDAHRIRGEVSNDRMRLEREEVIRLNSRIFVIGHAQQRRDIVAAEIVKSANQDMFLISTQAENAVSNSLRLQFWAFGAAGLLLVLFGIFVRGAQVHPADPTPMAAYVKGAAGYFLVWLAAASVMLFNSLIDLRQRVRKAWAGIDVELKRRADLLPRLAKIVEALLGHEAKAQPLIAALRDQAGATAPGSAGPDPEALTAPLKLVSEAYPSLKAENLFPKMQYELAQTEERIALARKFFNETATFYNTRLELFPDGLVAGIAGMKTQPLMNAAGFIVLPSRMNNAGADTAGPCAKCAADLRSTENLRFCPFCGGDQLAPARDGLPGHCRACGGYQKAVSASDTRLAGNVLYCGGCGCKAEK